MMKSVRGAGLAACLALMAGLSACDDAPSEAAGTKAAGADPDIYGVDGYETVNGVSFVSAQAMYDRFAKGEIACSKFVFADNTCTYASYSTMVRPGVLTMIGYRVSVGYDYKMLYPWEIQLKGKYLCETLTEQSIRSWTANYSRDNLPKTSPGDYSLEPEALETWRDSNLRTSNKALGVESCYRYSQVIEDGKPVPGTYYAYEFIDGIMQPNRELVPVAMFKGADLEQLRLRPQ